MTEYKCERFIESYFTAEARTAPAEEALELRANYLAIDGWVLMHVVVRGNGYLGVFERMKDD